MSPQLPAFALFKPQDMYVIGSKANPRWEWDRQDGQVGNLELALGTVTRNGQQSILTVPVNVHQINQDGRFEPDEAYKPTRFNNLTHLGAVDYQA